MAKFNIHAGHCPDGKGASGAVGILKESTEARKVKNKVIVLLKKEGHTAYDCTCDEKTTQSGCLTKVVKKCNAHTVKRDVSIHLNSGRDDLKGAALKYISIQILPKQRKMPNRSAKTFLKH